MPALRADWFNRKEILPGREQHGEKVGYCYPSRLEKTLCKWDMYVLLVTKGVNNFFKHIYTLHRLRWSRGSVLAFGTQVRGFKLGRSHRIFKGKKILSTPSFGGEVKPSVPYRRFAACKRSLELRGSQILDEICRNISRPRRVPPSAARGL